MKTLEFAFEICPVPMLLVDQAGTIVLTSEPFDQIFGYEPKELVGQAVEVLVPETAREQHAEVRAAFFRLPAKREMGRGRDLSGVAKDGRIFPLELGLNSVEVEGKCFALVTALDISHRKAMEARIQAVLDASASAVVLCDAEGAIVFANRAALLLFGYCFDELSGQPVEALIPDRHPIAHPVYRRSFMQKVETRPMGQGRRLYARARNGDEVPVEIALTPVETHEGNMVMCTMIDLSERVAAERAMEAKAGELEQLNLDLSRFANSASHDLKAPMSSLAGLIRLCLEDLKDGDLDEVRGNLREAEEISRRGIEKVESVLAIARVGNQTLEYQDMCVRDEIRATWRDLTASTEAAPELTLDLRHRDPVRVEAQSLRTILENLLSNAARYVDADKAAPAVRVSSEIRSGALCMSVEDNGVGIDPENLPRLFRMFERLDQRSESGLGLALVRRQLDRLGGSIDVTSTPGEGTAFRFEIPIEAEEETP